MLKLKKDFVLLSNAPRPNKNVKIFCEKLGMDKALSHYIFTSGEAALSYLRKNLFSEKFFHPNQLDSQPLMIPNLNPIGLIFCPIFFNFLI